MHHRIVWSSSLIVVQAVVVLTSLTCHSPTGPLSGADTTSSNFTFQTFTFGASNAGSSYLRDLTIISDSDIWAVGAVYLDSTNGAPDPDPYSAVHWDGKSWNLQRIPYIYQGQPFYHPIDAVFSLGADDIWFGGNGVEHWDGQQFSNVDGPNSYFYGHSVLRIWASEDNNVYMVGDGGTMAHYDGAWHGIQSATSLNINDIYGSNGQILAIASNVLSFPQDRRLLQISGNVVSAISDSGLPLNLSGVWFVSGEKYYIVGEGIHYKNKLGENVWQGYASGVVTSYYSEAVRGQDTNDVIVAGDFGELAHYNGKRWQTYWSSIPYSNSSFHAVSIMGNTIVAVGEKDNAAWIVVGKR